MTPEEAQAQTETHINRVGELIGMFMDALEKRAIGHDASKLESPEAEMFAGCTDKLNAITYGSPEYEEQRKKMLGEALGHHYENNSHHPEYFSDGISGMSLIDLVEMFCDHLAACERHKDGCPYKSLEHSAGRFKMPPELASILRNTVAEFKPNKGEGK